MNEVNVGLEAVLNIYHDTLGCNDCALSANRRNRSTLGSFGSASADIMVITDAPTHEDAEEGGLLMDEHGTLLMNLIEWIWYEDDEKMNKIRKLGDAQYFEEVRDYLAENIFFCSMVACPKREEGKVASAHVKACLDRVYKLIYAVDPIIIVALGSVPGNTLTSASGMVKHTRGSVYDMRIPSSFSTREIRYPCIITFHPRVLSAAGDQILVEREQGLTYECMQDFKKALNIVKTHKELMQ